MNDLPILLTRRSGVVSRPQLLALGLAPQDIRRLLRRRDLVVLTPGVYLDHTGEPTWLQESWGAVLALWPAALCHQSALRAADGPGRRDVERPLHVAVDRDRSPEPPPGVRLHRLADLDAKVQWNLCPPRIRIEEAVIDVAAEAGDDFAAVAVLSDAVQSRRTTAERMGSALSGRSRIPRRGFLEAVLQDIAAGTCSVLEHGYLDRVERPHRLPRAGRQVRDSARGPVYRDVDYRDEGLVVELNGRLFHDNAVDYDQDLERDLDLALSGRATVRLGWGQVFRRPCRTAVRIGALLQSRGWQGGPVPCSDCSQPGVRYAGATG